MCLALDFLQAISKVEKSRISGTILVVSKHKASVIMHTLPNKTATLINYSISKDNLHTIKNKLDKTIKKMKENDETHTIVGP